MSLTEKRYERRKALGYIKRSKLDQWTSVKRGLIRQAKAATTLRRLESIVNRFNILLINNHHINNYNGLQKPGRPNQMTVAQTIDMLKLDRRRFFESN